MSRVLKTLQYDFDPSIRSTVPAWLQTQDAPASASRALAEWSTKAFSATKFLKMPGLSSEI